MRAKITEFPFFVIEFKTSDMKSFRLIGLLLISTFVLTSCSKEKILAKRLEGMWTIDVYQKVVYGDGTPVPFPESNSAGNAGKMEFWDDGTGQYNVVKDLGQDMWYGEGEFDWTNTSETVSIRSTTGSTKKFDVVTNKKNKQVWERSQIYYFSDGEPGVKYTLEERITLVK